MSHRRKQLEQKRIQNYEILRRASVIKARMHVGGDIAPSSAQASSRGGYDPSMDITLESHKTPAESTKKDASANPFKKSPRGQGGGRWLGSVKANALQTPMSNGPRQKGGPYLIKRTGNYVKVKPAKRVWEFQRDFSDLNVRNIPQVTRDRVAYRRGRNSGVQSSASSDTAVSQGQQSSSSNSSWHMHPRAIAQHFEDKHPEWSAMDYMACDLEISFEDEHAESSALDYVTCDFEPWVDPPVHYETCHPNTYLISPTSWIDTHPVLDLAEQPSQWRSAQKQTPGAKRCR